MNRPTSAEETVERRLRGRLARERAARLEAERISERATRDLYERQADLRLLQAVSAAANQADDVSEALAVALPQICARAAWQVGHAYVLDPEERRLVPAGAWYLEDPGAHAPFREALESGRPDPGASPAGRVLSSGEPAWIGDVREDPSFPGAAAAGRVGLRAGLAFPVVSGTEVLGVLEFFSLRETGPGEALLGVMREVGIELGSVVERRRDRQQLERLGHRMEAVLACAGEGIYGLDADGVTRFVNPAAARMLGIRPEDAVGVPVHDVVHRSPSTHGRDACPLAPPPGSGSVTKSAEDVFRRADGRAFPVEYIRAALRDGDGVSGTVLTFSDVTERRRYESQLRHLADHDPLTDLFNRRRFESELERQVEHARRYGDGAALVLDLDSFKYVNDTLGHQAGDELIRSVAELLRRRLRTTDVLARLGGDEFAVLLPHASDAEARAVAAGLLDAVRGHTAAVAGRPVRVTTSIGIAPMDGGRELTAEEVLLEADVAMYDAKDAGRDCYAVYAPESRRRARPAPGMTWTERIRHALQEDGFVLHVQPIVDLASGRVSQYELLLRMRGAHDGELILPGAFIPPAERFGLIRDIDRWVVGAAFELLAELRRAGCGVDLLLEINLSGKSVGDPALPGLIASALEETRVDPSRLIFEITETAAIANMDDASRFARGLAELGCRFALDDFGAGFGSFYYLKHLPLDYLKIDGDYIENLPRSPVDQRMVKAMVEVARGLEMKTIAERVGDDESVRLLRELGVDYAQGFHLGRPGPIESLTRG